MANHRAPLALVIAQFLMNSQQTQQLSPIYQYIYMYVFDSSAYYNLLFFLLGVKAVTIN